MGKRGTWLVIAAVAAAVAIGVGVVGFALGGSDQPSSSAEYEAVVVQTRDRVDFVLGRLSTAQSLEELLTRMDEAAKTIDAAAGDLDEVTPPKALEDEHGRLVSQLEALSADVQGTANQAREPGFENILLGAKGLNFPSWDAINAILRDLQKQGIDVEPLSRHATT
jgi:ABC-type transporter Mla subunit MlaD